MMGVPCSNQGVATIFGRLKHFDHCVGFRRKTLLFRPVLHSLSRTAFTQGHTLFIGKVWCQLESVCPPVVVPVVVSQRLCQFVQVTG